jgi:hypothetical protein
MQIPSMEVLELSEETPFATARQSSFDRRYKNLT